jgi:hypothetical protein
MRSTIGCLVTGVICDKATAMPALLGTDASLTSQLGDVVPTDERKAHQLLASTALGAEVLPAWRKRRATFRPTILLLTIGCTGARVMSDAY